MKSPLEIKVDRQVRTARVVILTIAVITSLVLMLPPGGSGLDEAQAAENDYCERVADGVHTDYRKLCKEGS